MGRLMSIAGMLAVLGGPAAAQSTGVYIRADVGLAFGTSSTEVDTNPWASNASLGTTVIWGTHAPSMMFDVGVGYRFAPFLRFEGSVGYIPSMAFFGTFDGSPSNTARSSISALVGLATAYVDIDGLVGALPWNIQPFVLGGVGVANVNNGPENDYFNRTYTNTFSGTTSTNVAWTAGAGVGIPLSSDLTLDVVYRYLDLGERRVGPWLTSTGAPAYLTHDKADLRAHVVTIGLRFAL